MTGSITSQAHADGLHFFEADVVGNPVADLAGKIPGRFLCRSDVKPMHSYYISTQDHELWRGSELNLDQTPREVGASIHNTWGPLDPRSGYLLQQHATKAASVCAARAADIVTVDPGEHIADPYAGGEGSVRTVRHGDTSATTLVACEQSGGNWVEQKGVGKCHRAPWRQWRIAHNTLTANWQMIVPHPSKECLEFGTANAPSTAPDGQYAWQWWQEYRCCRKRGIYLGKIGD